MQTLIGYGGAELHNGQRVMDLDIDGEPVYGQLYQGASFRSINDWLIKWDDGADDTIVLTPHTLRPES